jgi:DNA-binding response OmpR family regulator
MDRREVAVMPRVSADQVCCPECGHEFIPPCEVLRLGDVVLDTCAWTLTVAGEERHLARKPMQVLAAMMRRPGHCFSPDVLMDLTHSWDVEPHAIDVQLHHARVAVADAIEIRNHPGVGWSLHERTEVMA